MYVRFLGEGLESRDAQMGSRFLCIRFGYSRTRFAGIIIGVRGVGGLVSFRGKDRAACDVEHGLVDLESIFLSERILPIHVTASASRPLLPHHYCPESPSPTPDSVSPQSRPPPRLSVRRAPAPISNARAR